MLDVVPLRYGTAFRKAFADPLAFAALARGALEIEFSPARVEQEFSYGEPVARVNVAYDLFAEDTSRRIVVELQHVREPASYDRLLYYHCVGLVEQIVSSERYVFQRDVYTLIVLTRWPDEPALRFGRAIADIDPVTHDGRKLGVYRHRLVFVNARAPEEMLPVGLRPLMALVDDSLDGHVDETKYRDEVSRGILERIKRSALDPDENARLKEEGDWEQAQREHEARGRAEGEAQGLRAGITALCEVLGIELTPERRSTLDALEVEGLVTFQNVLTRERRWPAEAPRPRPRT